MEDLTFQPSASDLHALFDRLLEAYGPQAWWPGDSPFEIMVGAILTQNTAWSNVERAIGNIKECGLLSLEGLLSLSTEHLAELIRPAGYFNVKARRLGNYCRFLERNGNETGLARMETLSLRRALLSVNGVGPETADDILLYAFGRPVFVIDAYTRRIFSRLGLAAGDESYEDLQRGFETALEPDAPLFNEYHALIVRHTKEACALKPRCSGCCLETVCLRESVCGPE